MHILTCNSNSQLYYKNVYFIECNILYTIIMCFINITYHLYDFDVIIIHMAYSYICLHPTHLYPSSTVVVNVISDNLG